MRFEHKILKSFILDLNEEEACWLRATMQNPLFNQNPDEEDQHDKEMRMKFFSAVEKAGRR